MCGFVACCDLWMCVERHDYPALECDDRAGSIPRKHEILSSASQWPLGRCPWRILTRCDMMCTPNGRSQSIVPSQDTTVRHTIYRSGRHKKSTRWTVRHSLFFGTSGARAHARCICGMCQPTRVAESGRRTDPRVMVERVCANSSVVSRHPERVSGIVWRTRESEFIFESCPLHDALSTSKRLGPIALDMAADTR